MARTRHIGVLLVVATLLLWGSAAAATTSLSIGGGSVDTASTAQVQQQDAENASVTFEDQSVENGTVTVANVTVPEGGYVAIHNDSLQDGQAVGSVVGVSEYLEPGTHENVTVTLYEDVPGADFENATMPEGTETLIAMPHQETSEEMAGNETTTTEDGVGENQTTTDDGQNDTTTTTGVNDTTTTDDGTNDTTTTDDGTNDTTTTDGGVNTTTTSNVTTTSEANSTQTANAQQENQTNQTYDFVATDGEEDGPYIVDGAVVIDSAEVDFSAPATDDDEGAGAADNDTEANETQAGSSFVVESIEAPALAAPNSTITVNATISNSADEEGTEDVAFRLAGDDADVVVHQDVSVDADGNETVTFDLNASDVGEGEYIHGVTTENSSKFATIEVTNDSQVRFTPAGNDGANVTVDSVFVPEGGYVAVHNASLLDGDAVGSVVGVSEYLEPGVHENVSVTLYEGVEGAEFATDASTEDNATLIAMPHQETTGDETYDFVASDGEDDGPYTVDGEVVLDFETGNEQSADGGDGADDGQGGGQGDGDDGQGGGQGDGDDGQGGGQN